MSPARIFLILLTFCLCSCSADRYYFHQRIGHSGELLQETKTVTLENQASPVVAAATTDTLSLVKEERAEVIIPEERSIETMGTKEQDVQPENKDQPVTGLEKTETKPVQTIASYNDSDDDDSDGFYLGPWMIVLLVAVGIFLISTCVALLLGYSIGHACLIGVEVLAIIILILIYLLLLALTRKHH